MSRLFRPPALVKALFARPTSQSFGFGSTVGLFRCSACQDLFTDLASSGDPTLAELVLQVVLEPRKAEHPCDGRGGEDGYEDDLHGGFCRR